MAFSTPDKKRAWARAYYKRNREKELERNRRYHEENRDKVHARRRAYADENRELLAAKQRERRLRDPVRSENIWRKSYYKTHYGMTPEQFDEMVRNQGGKCAICGADKPGGRGARFHVDHDHVTGTVRGLLCVRCNMKLGWYEKYQSEVMDYLLAHAPGVAA